MATRFMRIDLSAGARDFRPIALEPGLPLLDASGANDKILFRWLGGKVAEPECDDDDSVNFYVRNDHGGRLEDVVCQPATREDLEKLLQDDLAILRDRLDKAKPETPTERALKKRIRRSLAELTEDPNREDLDSFFFRYRDAQGRWRLVWCWGYQRVEQEPAPAVICTDPECNLLFVRHRGQSPKCPSCAANLATRPRKTNFWKKAGFLALLLLIIAAVLAWYYLTRELIVTPEKLDMVVGEINQLKVERPEKGPAHFSSSDPALLEIDQESRLIARAKGDVQVRVTRGRQWQTVDVTITAAEFQSIAVEPAQAVVHVDDTVPIRVLGRIAGERGGRDVEIAPALLSCSQRPSSRYAEFDLKRMTVRGVRPTVAGSPETLTLSYRDHPASATVEVVMAPFELTLSPQGPIDLPLGQQMRLEGWANFEDGRRAQIPAGRLKFDAQSTAESASGLELRGNKVAALKPNAGPLSVRATYLGRQSKPVVFRSVEAEDLALRLEVDRTLRLAGETGQMALLGVGPRGDVELVDELATYASSDPGIIEIDEKTGAFRAATPGEATITGGHLAANSSTATEPSEIKLKVYDPAHARLVFEPAAVRVAVDEVARLQLFVEAQDGDQVERAPLMGPGVGYGISEPEAIRWSPPTLVGLRPSGPFELRASYSPILDEAATAQVEVTPAVETEPIRVMPNSVSLAPGQSLPLAVEQQLPDAADQWRELRGDAITWTVPPELQWTPATDDLRPMVTIPAGVTGKFTLQAEHAGRQTACRVTIKERGPDPHDPAAGVLVEREPPGEYVPLGTQQRYAVVVEKDGVGEPAAAVIWPEDFENEFVRWQAPVLTAKKAGYRQWFRAEADGRSVMFKTSTYQPGRLERSPVREDLPVAVRILTDQDQPVRMPVGGQFNDFRVEADYADGFTVLVTEEATLRTAQPGESAPLTASEGRLIGIRPGRTTIEAEFEGVRSEQQLAAEVLADLAELDVDELRIIPAPIKILPGETVSMDVVGYAGGRSVGVITGLGDMVWKSGNPEIARVDGSSVTGVNVGQGTVTVQLGELTSEPHPVHVVEFLADDLVVDREVIRIHVGESVHVGAGLSIFRGDMDLSEQCDVTPAIPAIVRYVAETHSLLGVAPGGSAVTFTFGDKMARAMIEVVQTGDPIDGEVVIEPAAGTLAPGQALPLRVYVKSPTGHRFDRTDAAVFSSSDPATVKLLGNRACALAGGTSEITVALPGTEKTGKAYLTVNDEPITELLVEPPQLDMSTGDLRRLRILGRASSGLHELFPQADLKVTLGGPNPAAIRLGDAHYVDAVQPGQATVAVDWQDRLKREVPVRVVDHPLNDLRIDPLDQAIHPGQALVYQVTGMRGGQLRVLGPEDGVKLSVSEDKVAKVAGGLTVVGNEVGDTLVTARLGEQQAETALHVVPGTGPIGVVDGPGWVEYYGPGGGYWGGSGRGYWHDGYRYWDGHDWIISEGAPPPAAVNKLRFSPEVLHLATDTPPTPVRVIEVLADGSDGRDVTADPNLDVGPSSDVVTVVPTETGPKLRPGQPGQTRLGAKLGTLTADPLLVSVGEGPFVLGAAGVTLSISPPQLKLALNSAAEPIVVTETMGDGSTRDVTADPDLKITPQLDVVAIDKTDGGRVVRPIAQGQTQLVAEYHGRQAIALVTVAGKRFVAVNVRYNAVTRDMAVEILADASAGPLEYRGYREGQAPPADWEPATEQEIGEYRQVELTIPPTPEDAGATSPPVIIESRDPSGSVEQFQVRF